MTDSFYWFDFETFGVNPAKDKPSQFAGIRTDFDFNIIDDPLNIYCKPANDFIPSPEACLVTGISPQLALEKGLSEREFFRQIHLQISTANTCTVGYNNIRFDDEVIRHGFYRNFYDAYAREWQNGNSRWDIIDMLRMTHALRPEGIAWPKDEQGVVSFRLERLSKANGIEHEDAHDALADVYATINMAKLVKQKQPKLFEYLLSLRNKRLVMTEIDLVNHKPFVHCSGMLGNTHQYTGVMLPLSLHPTNKNSVICIDLTRSVDGLLDLTAEQIQLRIFTRQDELPEGVERIAIKEVHYNKCPAVAPLGVLNADCQQRLGFNLEQCLENAELLKSGLKEFSNKLFKIYSDKKFEKITNPDHALYSGGFFSSSDKNKMEQIRESDWQSLADSSFQFSDNRLEELLFRYRARNAIDTLNASELARWERLRASLLFDQDSGAPLVHGEYQELMIGLRSDESNDQRLLDKVDEYVNGLVASTNHQGS
ncbi:MAG: exodeoxyribonuclease I [Kangiellaceae bacterium]|nr:exodeoxyribonuclease I [Kangiellaceae bacterium]